MDIQEIKQRRLKSWCQDGHDRVPDSQAAIGFVNRLGIATLYSASPEVPNLYWAYVSEAGVKSEAKWDSPSGHVYGWRWDLGRSDAAFYGSFVAKKPTWISWGLLPLVLGFAMDRRDPEMQYSDGLISNEAIRILRAFEGTNGTLSTKDLRQRAGFPTGKAERAAYLRGVEELDSRLMLAKTFDVGGEADDMFHSLVRMKYGTQFTDAMKMEPDEALTKFLAAYLAQSVYFDSKLFCKHIRVPRARFENAISELVSDGRASLTNGFVIDGKLSQL